MVLKNHHQPSGRLSLPDRVRPQPINIGQAHKRLGPLRLQPSQKRLGLGQVAADAACLEQPQGLRGIVLGDLDAGGHGIGPKLGGLKVGDDLQYPTDARALRRYLPVERSDLPREIQQNIDMESYRVQQIFEGSIALDRGEGEVEPIIAKGGYAPPPEEIEALSQIIRELNERFGTDFSEKDKVFIEELEQRLTADAALAASVRANVPENARLTFDYVVNDRLQEMVDTNFEFYKRVTDDPEFGKFFLDWLFERFRKSIDRTEEV